MIMLVAAGAAIVTPGLSVMPTPQSGATGPSDSTTSSPAVTPDAAGLERVLASLYPLIGKSGFGSITRDNATASVTLYWKGEPPSVSADVRRLSEGLGVRFVVEQAAYSAAELVAGAEAIKSTVDLDAPTVASIGYAPDSSGLVVELIEGDPTVGKSSVRLRRTKESLRATTTVPVKYRLGGLPIERARNDMSAPFKGGGVLLFSDGAVCTSGFAVTRGGVGYLLTAAHCFPSGNPNWVRNGVGDNIANAPGEVDVAPAWDSLLIDPDPSPATIGKVFHGGLNTDTKIDVAGRDPAVVGDQVCVSGANTGGTAGPSDCSNAELFQLNQFLCNDAQFWCHGAQVVTTQTIEVIGGSGDSGAPVYVRQANGKASARGIYVNGVDGHQRFCRHMRYGPNTEESCDTQINIAGIGWVVNRWDANLETN